MIYTHVLNRGGPGVKSPADLLGESGVGLPDEAAACTVEAEWAADSGNVPPVGIAIRWNPVCRASGRARSLWPKSLDRK